MTATVQLPIHVRAYVPSGNKPKPGTRRPELPSHWSLVFDCETTTDEAQQLRIGTYQVRVGSRMKEQGFFYDPEALSREELATLRAEAAKQKLRCLTKDDFVETVFYRIGYELRASIIGFNLPFDLSRLALDHNPARRGMKGGFTFRLSEDKYQARVQIRHINRRASFIQFAGKRVQRVSRSERKRGVRRGAKRGHFVDLATLAHALYSRSFTLESLSEFLGTETRKHASAEHGKKLTPDYLRYAMTDVQATWECYCALSHHFDRTFGLKHLPLGRIFSEASLGKAYLRAMGIKPWQVCQPDFPDAITGQILSAYFGGRSEVRVRRSVRQVLYCDFLSMYPTVCTLMGLWRFVIADGMTYRDATEETRAFLEHIDLVDLQSQDTWKRLTVLVQVEPDDDLFPVRAAYGEGPQATIGLNRLSRDTPLWFTLADCIASAALKGKPPKIAKAIAFEPGPPQTGLHKIEVPGGGKVDPARQDFYRALIDHRQVLKSRQADAEGGERDRYNVAQNSLKIIANATSYGGFVEVNVEDLVKPLEALCYGPAETPFPVTVDKTEKPGPFFHPLLGTLITGAARLMLALTERQIVDAGLEWVLCDTDSMAIARPEGMEEAEFYSAARAICDWFEPLNPYTQKGPVLKIEDANYRLDGTGELEPLFAFAVSAKRYVLFNLDADGKPVVRKASAHGLGHFRDPYPEKDAPNSIPAPQVPLDDIGVRRWQYDLWHQIILAAFTDTPERVDLSYHPAMNAPAIARYSVTTPMLDGWFKSYNAGKPYARRVTPFNFLVSLTANPLAMPEVGQQGRLNKKQSLRPIAPFDSDPEIAASRAFDRVTGEAVPREALKTFRQALSQYHLHPEDKFLGGGYLDIGTTERRHVEALVVVHIGKEANKWEEQDVLGFDVEALLRYGTDALDGGVLRAHLANTVSRMSLAEAARRTGSTPFRIRRLTAAENLGPSANSKILAITAALTACTKRPN